MKSIQEPLFRPPVEWTVPEELKNLTQAKEIAIDFETRDEELTTRGSGVIRGNGEVVGIAVAVDGWQGYFPIAHEGGGNIDKKIVLDWFENEVLKTPATKIFHMQCMMFPGYALWV